MTQFDQVPRTGSHWVRVVILALIPILIVAGGGGYLLLRHAKPDTRQADSEAALRAYLNAWSKADYAGMAAHADVPAATIAAIDGPLRRDLVVSTATFIPGLLTRDQTGDRGSAPYTATLRLTGLGNWIYAGTLPLVLGKDAAGKAIWRVHFTPAAIQPRLMPGTMLIRTHVSPKRGALLDATGIVLRGADGELDSNLLGTVGPLTAAQAKAAGPAYVAGDVGGITGIERAYSAQLGGRPGGSVRLMRGAITLATLATYPDVAGKNLTTTLDLRVQRAGESALAGEALPSALVAIDTRTGGVLSIVNSPLGGFGRAVRGHYPPGSTFKVVTMTAALLAGKTETTPVSCPPSVDIDGVIFKNSGGESFGQIDLRKAFAVSCNTAFVNLRESLTAADMQRAVDLYGFNSGDPLPITSFGGSYPKPSGPVDVAAAAFGQAAVESSPLQMATIAAGVAASKWRNPFVVGQATVTHIIPPTVDAQLKDLMRAVLTDPQGTAVGVPFPGIVYGKTGTAEYGTGSPLPTHAWFIGFRDTVAFCVLVEGGGFGAAVAAPIASRFLASLGPS